MSENGPREGTRDLPKGDRDAGHKSVEAGTPAGVAYASLGRAARRRREEILELARQGHSAPRVAELYRVAHPLEPPVTPDEVQAISGRR